MQPKRKVIYEIEKNTRKSSFKIYKSRGKEIYVKLTSKQKDGKVLTSIKEKEGINEVRIESIRPHNYTKTMLDKEVEELFNNVNVDGFEGNISAFGDHI